MSNPRKRIILNEILFWKQNKLLPEQYCDFLMTLYTEGNDEELEQEFSHKKAVKSKEKRRTMIIYLFVLLVSIALLAILFMNSQGTEVMILLIGVLSIAFIISAFKVARKKNLLAPLYQVAAALLIFGLSVKVSLTYFEQKEWVLYVLLIANCLFWLLSGLKLKLLYFTVSGALGLIVLIGYKLIV
ncbi:hypothetical protein ACIQ34_14520 [Ureibacillus sp. NPDC094379]